LDLSRQKISQKDFSSLLEFVQSRKVIESFNDMRQGKTVNIPVFSNDLVVNLI
jgi:hypothetical protein